MIYIIFERRGEQLVPLLIVEVGGNQGRFARIAQIHQLEKGIDLFLVKREVAQFTD